MKKTIKITYTFGSDFQEKLALDLLDAIMKTYKSEFENQHKDNLMELEIK